MPLRSVAEATSENQGQIWSPVSDAVTAGVAATLSEPAGLLSDPEALRRTLDDALVEGVRLGVEQLASRWAEGAVGAMRYERSGERVGYLSGHRNHTIRLKLGPVSVRVPKPRQGPSRPEWLAKLKRTPESLVEFVRQLWHRGLSYRDLAAISEEALGETRSHTAMGGWVSDVAEEVLRWLNRPISPKIRYLALDALYVPVVRESSKKEPLLVALGITQDGHKEVLDVLHAPSESTENWGSLLSRLRLRKLDTKQLALVITDGHEGLIGAVEKHLPRVPRQRCTVHKVRNVVGHCPRDLKSTAPGEAAAIFKAPSRSEARRRAADFVAKYETRAPKLAEIITNDFDACLTFYDFDAKRWDSLRSTNALERLNREFRRKLREVGAMKAEVNVMRIAVEVARFVNTEMRDKPIAGFRKRRKSAPTT